MNRNNAHLYMPLVQALAAGGIHRRIERHAGSLRISGPRMRLWGFHCPQQGWLDYRRFTRPGATGETGAGCDG